MIRWRRITAREASEVVKARQEAAAGADPELCEGTVQLEIMPFESFHQINRYTKYLSTLQNVKIVSECWSEEDGFIITVSVQVPLALGRLLQDMPEVARVHVNGKNSGYRKSLIKMVVEVTPPAAELEPLPA